MTIATTESTITDDEAAQVQRERHESHTRCLRSRALAAAFELGPLGDAVRGDRLHGRGTAISLIPLPANTSGCSLASATVWGSSGQPGSSKAPVLYFVFDVMVLAGRDVMHEPLAARRELLKRKILPKLGEPVRYAAPLDASLPVLIESVKAQGLEGLVAKRLDSRYEAGLRSGAWQKMRVNRGQEFVIGGYTVGTKTFDALVFGYYEGDRLIYAARTRNGFTPVVREQLFKKFRGLEIRDCPFANLPEAKSGRWGAGLTAAKMKDCQLAEAGAGRANRVPGVDGRKSPAPHQVHCAARRQTGRAVIRE
jgi:hypothetical protein